MEYVYDLFQTKLMFLIIFGKLVYLVVQPHPLTNASGRCCTLYINDRLDGRHSKTQDINNKSWNKCLFHSFTNASLTENSIPSQIK